MKKPAKNGEPRKPRLTNVERHERFVETAKIVEASDLKEEFDRAFKVVVSFDPKRLSSPRGKD